MYVFNRQMWGRALLLATAAVMVGAVFISGAFAQGYDTAYVPFMVNVNATVSASDGATQRQVSVTANQEATLRLPIQRSPTGVQNEAQRRINAPAIINGISGKVTVNLPAQTYKKAEILLYTVNGKRLLRYNASAAGAANSVSRPNLAPGVYLLSVRGTGEDILTSRLAHDGGGLNISVAFGGDDLSSSRRLAKEAAAGDWTITVSAAGYADTVYTLRPAVGTNARQNITLRTVALALDVPANVTAAAASTTSITVTWSAVSGATGYRVYRSTDASGAYSQVANTTSTSYTNSSLTSGTTYYYKVAAYTSAGEGTQSAYVSATTVPAAPASVTATASSNGVAVSWAQVSGAAGYYVYRGATASGTYSKVADVASAPYTDSEVSPGTSYYYKVSAYTSGGESSQSAYVSVTTPSALPPAPANVTATAKSKTSITLSWSSVAGATRYYVYRNSTIGDGNYSYNLGNTTAATYINTGLTEGTTYYYKVSAYNSVGQGPQSAHASAAPGIITDIFTDVRDDKTYKTVVIGGKVWMAENLNFESGASGSMCSMGSCANYGRLYDWYTAQIVCPAGWHLPSRQEWGDLAITAGGTDTYGASGTAGMNLKSTSGWGGGSSGSYNGTDDFGFTALPGGGVNNSTVGYYGLWWTATESGSDKAYYRRMDYDHNNVNENNEGKRTNYSVRCVMND